MPPPTHGDFSALIRRCSSLSHLKSVHAAALRHLLALHPPVASDLISRYALLGSTSLAHSAFSSAASSSFSPPSQPLFDALIRAYADHGAPDAALDLYRRMRPLGLPRDYRTFPIVIKACSALRDLEIGRSVHRDAIDLGFASHVAVLNALVGFYGKCGRLDVARSLFDGIPQRTPVSWSALIAAYTHNDRREEATAAFSAMIAEGVRPNRGALVSLMGCTSDLDSAAGLWRLVGEEGLEEDVLVRDAAVGMYARCGAVDLARKVFDETPERSFLSWNSMIEGYAQAGSALEALALFAEMVAGDITLAPDSQTLHSVFLACCRLGLRSTTLAVHGYTTKNFEDGVKNFQLIDVYTKCGMLGAARRLFDRMPEKDVASWNSMISGYGMHGHGQDALDLFGKMKDAGLRPDHGTFSSVLSSCWLADLVDEGKLLFDSMKEFSLDPEPVHCAYVVGMLGRVGQLEEAREFMKSMPVKPDASVWEILLSACRKQNDLELAESAARSLLELDPQNARCFVLLSSIYRCSGREKEAEEMEVLMKERAVRKIAGFSFVEVNHIVYKFVTGDRSHLQSDEIYKELERLFESIREHGYQPDKNLVLHDVEEETLAETLHAHSEKLAIAFGLLTSGPDDEILISKNVSICPDCHAFAKLVSKVAGRIILLRDAHRFHHFTNGTCSCRDCW